MHVTMGFKIVNNQPAHFYKTIRDIILSEWAEMGTNEYNVENTSVLLEILSEYAAKLDFSFYVLRIENKNIANLVIVKSPEICAFVIPCNSSAFLPLKSGMLSHVAGPGAGSWDSVSRPSGRKRRKATKELWLAGRIRFFFAGG